jgi:hypothetical protein
MGHEWFHAMFPPRNYALLVPTAIIIVPVSVVVTFIGAVLVRGGGRKRASGAEKRRSEASADDAGPAMGGKEKSQ